MIRANISVVSDHHPTPIGPSGRRTGTWDSSIKKDLAVVWFSISKTLQYKYTNCM